MQFPRLYFETEVLSSDYIVERACGGGTVDLLPETYYQLTYYHIYPSAFNYLIDVRTVSV